MGNLRIGMSRRFGAVAALAAASAMFLSACSGGTATTNTPAQSGSESGAAAPAAGGGKVLIAISTLSNPFFIDMRDGALEAAKANGLEASVVDAQDDPTTQANQLADAVSQGFDAVLLNATDSDALTPSVEALAAAGIPVVLVDRFVNNATYKTYVASDNVELGRLGGQALAEAVGGKGEVAVLRGISGLPSSNERFQGFNDAMKQFPDIKVVAAQGAEYDRAKGMDVMSNILQANPNIVGVFAENDEMALGAVQALGSAAGKSVFVVGIDGTPDALDAIKTGTMYASVAQQATEMGKAGMDAVSKVLQGQTLDQTTVVPVKVVKAS